MWKGFKQTQMMGTERIETYSGLSNNVNEF